MRYRNYRFFIKWLPLLFLILVCFITLPCLADTSRVVSSINFITTKIEIVKDGNVIGSATGFFFRDQGVKYLATNRHVVVEESNNHCPDALHVILHTNKVDLTQNRKVTIPLYCKSIPIWLQHPNYKENKCDVVLIPLNENTLPDNEFKIFFSLAITFIGSENINTQDVNSFGSVVVVGYPLGFYDEVHNLPVYRKATIASCYGVNFNGLPYFLVDANLHPGMSGSPVVNSHHTLFKEGDGKEGYALFGVNSAQHIRYGNPLGLNVVWYGHLLVEISKQ